jgi:predicted TIM-barrel fold metal-dependent hydrolase
MRVIAIEEHFTTEDLIGAEGADGGGPTAKLLELGEGRIADMDAAGVDVQVISTRAPAVQNLSATDAVPLARAANDRLAEAVAAHPDRFAGFATLPTPAPAEAAAELERTVREYGFKGAILHGHTSGRFLDAEEFRPILECAEGLGVPLYLHPTPPIPAVFDAYFGGLAAPVAGALAKAGWGWHAEAGLHALRLMVSGVFDRYPTLQMIIGHMGEYLPFSIARADTALRAVTGHLGRSVADYFTQNFHITTSAYFTLPPLQCAMSVVGVDRIMFAVDYPFCTAVDGVDFLRSVPLSDVDRAKIAHVNAERLLTL